jgi:hypothetical protein
LPVAGVVEVAGLAEVVTGRAEVVTGLAVVVGFWPPLPPAVDGRHCE